jgi:hypothetical protein
MALAPVKKFTQEVWGLAALLTAALLQLPSHLLCNVPRDSLRSVKADHPDRIVVLPVQQIFDDVLNGVFKRKNSPRRRHRKWFFTRTLGGRDPTLHNEHWDFLPLFHRPANCDKWQNQRSTSAQYCTEEPSFCDGHSAYEENGPQKEATLACRIRATVDLKLDNGPQEITPAASITVQHGQAEPLESSSL